MPCQWTLTENNMAKKTAKATYLQLPPKKLKAKHIHAAPRQGPPAPRSQGVISASVVVAPGQIFYATIIQKPCI